MREPETVVAVDARYLRRPEVGISAYLIDLIEELGRVCSVELVTSSEAHARKLRNDFDGPAVVVLSERRETVWEQRAIPEYLARARPAAYIAGANRGLPARPVKPVRLGLVIHDLIPLRTPMRLVRDPFYARRYLLGTAISVARADLIIANSQSTARDVRRLRRSAPVVVRYPSVPIPAVSEAAWPGRWPSRFLLHCGGADPRKNVEGLVEGHEIYRANGGDLPLMVLGSGFELLLEKLGDRATGPAVTFTDRVSEELKWAALGRATAMLYPSSWEGFGLPILEAFATGTPVMAGRGGAQVEVGGDAAIYVDVRNPESIADGIRRVLDPAWRADVALRGHARLEEIRRARIDARDLVRRLVG